MENYVGSSTAGTKLKAKSGWNNNGNGTDDYGFSALPGGYGESDGSFGDVGYYGGWWSASDRVSEDFGDAASFLGVIVNREYIDWNTAEKSALLSVRCLQD